jgi:hypothetical protein
VFFETAHLNTVGEYASFGRHVAATTSKNDFVQDYFGRTIVEIPFVHHMPW